MVTDGQKSESLGQESLGQSAAPLPRSHRTTDLTARGVGDTDGKNGEGQGVKGKNCTLTLSSQRQHTLGNDRFRGAIERQLGRCAGPAERTGQTPKAPAAKKQSESAL